MKSEGFVLVNLGASATAFSLEAITLSALQSDEVLIESEALGSIMPM